MTLPENALSYNDYSLQELRKFARDRQAQIEYTQAHAQSYKKRSRGKKEKDKRRKLIAALRKDDETATFNILGLPLELREEVYFHFVMQHDLDDDQREHLQLMPRTIREEMIKAFDRERPRHDASLEVPRKVVSAGTLRIGLDSGMSTTRVSIVTGGGGITSEIHNHFSAFFPSTNGSPGTVRLHRPFESDVKRFGAFPVDDLGILPFFLDYSLPSLPSSPTTPLETVASDTKPTSNPQQALIRCFDEIIRMGLSLEALLCLISVRGQRQQTLKDYMKRHQL